MICSAAFNMKEIVVLFTSTAKQKKVNIRHPADTQRYFNRPLGENKIGREYQSAGRNIAHSVQHPFYPPPLFKFTPPPPPPPF